MPSSLAPFPFGLLRPYRERPCRRHAAEQRDELAALQLIEFHSIPASQTRIVRYRIEETVSGGMGLFHNPPTQPESGPGQTRSLERCPLHDRSSPESGSPSMILLCRKRAKTGHRLDYSITSSARASSVGGTGAERFGGCRPPLLLQQSPRSRTRFSHACFAGRVTSGLRRFAPGPRTAAR